jgi:tetratricopeptide (TPR) repeat protein
VDSDPTHATCERPNDRAEGGKWSEAVEVYAKGVAASPKDTRFVNNLGWLAQEWGLKQAAGGIEEAVVVLKTMRQRFPELKEVSRAATTVCGRVVQELIRSGKFEEALRGAERTTDVLSADELAQLLRNAYDAWAHQHTSAREWEQAVSVYEKALKRLPNDGHLTNNAIVTWDSWARTYLDRKDWDGAIGVYDRALKAFP